MPSRLCLYLYLYLYPLLILAPIPSPLQVPTGERLTPTQWIGRTNRLFAMSGLYTPNAQDDQTGVPAGMPNPIRHPDDDRPMHCTNQSIRRSAAQWAGRCGAEMRDAKNTGRWKSVAMLVKYMGHGAFVRAAHESGGDDDPIFLFWVYLPSTTGDAAGHSAL